ncbi:hypothetical protein Goari_004968 [Gossypium aridum]|uniref:Uncharacterized protein n=1 Tax=Gossypium aridum TaxID=34290 RepID=A0A7J8Y536_GOSAI|nr:hypothetical protein [Gossypium aridum]
MVPLFLLELKYHGCQCVVYSVDLSVILVSIVQRRMSAPDGGATLTSTFEVSSKGKVLVMDFSPTLKLVHVFLVGSNNRFEALGVELVDSNDVVTDDIDVEQNVVDDDNETEQLEFSPQKPRLASLAVAPLVRSLIATKQENLNKGKKKMNNSPTKGRGK